MNDNLEQDIAKAKRYIGAVWNVDDPTGFWIRAVLVDTSYANRILLLREHSGGYRRGHYLGSAYADGFEVFGDVTNFKLDPMGISTNEYFFVGCPRRTKFLKDRGLK